MSNEEKQPSRAQKYLAYVAALIERDKGASAALKRSLSGTSEHRRATYPYLLPLLEGLSPREQDLWILVAGLYALYPQPLHQERPRTFGSSCKELHDKVNSKGPERRFKCLLETDGNDLDVPLAALVRLMKANQINIDYVTLLTHLQHWDHFSQWVQDRWARDFWGGSASNSEDILTTIAQ